MHKLCLSLVAAGALVGSASTALAFEAMLGGNFNLYAQPHARHHIMTLGAGEIVNIDNCDRGWCAVTHGQHTGYIHWSRVLDGNVYSPYGGGSGYREGGPFEVGAGLVAAPANAAGQAVETSVGYLR